MRVAIAAMALAITAAAPLPGIVTEPIAADPRHECLGLRAYEPAFKTLSPPEVRVRYSDCFPVQRAAPPGADGPAVLSAARSVIMRMARPCEPAHWPNLDNVYAVELELYAECLEMAIGLRRAPAPE